MTIEPMLTEETPANALVARVLEEAGIEMVFGISGGHTGRIVSGLSQYQNRVRTVLVREESLGGVMAEVYGRLTRRPGVLLGQGPWVLGNGLLGTIEALSKEPYKVAANRQIKTLIYIADSKPIIILIRGDDQLIQPGRLPGRLDIPEWGGRPTCGSGRRSSALILTTGAEAGTPTHGMTG